MPTVNWVIEHWENKHPKTCHEEEEEKIRTLRWQLNVDEDLNYTLDELKEMMEENEK